MTWLAFAALYPFGPQRLSIESALLRMSVLTPHTKSGTTLNFEDFLVDFGKEEVPWEDKLAAWCLAHGGAEVDSNGGQHDRQGGTHPGDEG